MQSDSAYRVGTGRLGAMSMPPPSGRRRTDTPSRRKSANSAPRASAFLAMVAGASFLATVSPIQPSGESAKTVRVTLAEVGLAWALLVIFAAITYPAEHLPGPITLGLLLLAFLPGAVVLSRRSQRALVLEGLGHLLNETRGRLSLLAAIVVAILIAFTFGAFVAFVLTGMCCSLLWSADAIFGSRVWERRFGGWAATGLSAFFALAAIEGVLAWGPVARRLGTPAELAKWGRIGPDARDANYFGFRSPYEDTRRRPGVRRVIALGDSFTWGSKIASSDSTWPALLEQILIGEPNGRPTEVITWGGAASLPGTRRKC
jgi:hypothetical protein